MPTLPVSLYDDVAGPERALIGVSFDPEIKHATAVRLRVSGRGFGSRTEIEVIVQQALPETLASSIDDLASGSANSAALQSASQGMARLTSSLVEQIGRDGCQDPLAVGVADLVPGRQSDEDVAEFLQICDSALLAELSGLTVIDAFTARDLAQGGQGRVIDVLARWMLLHDAKKPRVLVDLSDRINVIYLPASCEASGAERVLFFEPGPAMDLWDGLAEKLPGQGGPRQNDQEPLSEQFLDILDCASGRNWLSLDRGYTPAMVDNLVSFAGRHGWSSVAAQEESAKLIAEIVGRTIAERIPKTPPLQEMILTGRGVEQKVLSDAITASQVELKTVSLDRLALSQESLSAATAAVLTLLHLDQVPATSTLHSGISSPRVLGRLTPGSPQNWRRVLGYLSENRPAMMSLRSAI